MGVRVCEKDTTSSSCPRQSVVKMSKAKRTEEKIDEMDSRFILLSV